MRTHLAALTIALTTACGPSGFEGTLTHGLTGQPIPEMRVVASAATQVSMTCMSAEATTDAAGKFKFENACVGDSAYNLKLADESLWLAETQQVPQGNAAPFAAKAWPYGGSGGGLYKLSSGKTEALRSSSDLTSDKLLGTEEVVQYPKAVPGGIPVIAPGEHLVLSGTKAVEKVSIVPMFKSPPRKFGDPKNPSEITNPWWYLAVEFTTDTEWKRHEAQVDASKFIEHAHGDIKVRWIPIEALQPGRYALVTEGDRRISIFDAHKAPEAAAPPAQ